MPLVVHGDDKEAVAQLATVPRVVVRTLESAVRKQRSSHAYQNRTHKLENGTQIDVVTEGPAGVAVTYEQDREYASFVHGRGFNDFPESAAEADKAIDATFSRFGGR